MVGYLALRSVLQQLVAEDTVDADVADQCMSRVTKYGTNEPGTPWFVRLLVGGSAWIAALFLLGFLGLIGFVSIGILAPLGIVIAAVAIGIGRAVAAAGGPPQAMSDFWSQLALLGSFLSRLLIAIGMYDVTDSLKAAAVALLVLEAAFLFLYPDTLQRFLVPIAAGAWAMMIVLDQPVPGARELVVVVASALTGYVWLRQAELLAGPYRAWQAPIGYGLATFVCGALLVGVSVASEWSDAERVPWAATAGLALLAAALLARVLAAHGLSLASRAGVAGVALIIVFALATWREPGLLAAASLLALGFHCRSRPLMVLAILFLAGFGVHFYYQMDLDFIRKSAVMLGSGVVLLVSWAGIRSFGQREVGQVSAPGEET